MRKCFRRGVWYIQIGIKTLLSGHQQDCAILPITYLSDAMKRGDINLTAKKAYSETVSFRVIGHP